jgi:HEAT repeat protein/cytochrome c552/cytochrome c554/c'-like protein
MDRRWFFAVVAAVGGLAIATGVVGARGAGADGGAVDPYVGAQTCATCHKSIHDTWTSGRHSKMIQPATAAAVKADFGKGTITLRGDRYRLSVRDGQYFITESILTGKEQEHRIDYTLGSRRIQHYLTTIDKGWIVVLPPSWDVQRREWFHNMEIVRPDEDDRLILQQWNRNCVGCHVSRQANGFDVPTRTFQTKWTDFGTSCERCHGPGRVHVDAHSAGRRTQSTQSTQSQVLPAGSPSSAWIVRPTRLDPVAATGVCAQCHSLRTAINPDYKAGDDYDDFFVPTLEYVPYAQPHVSQDPPYWADGRPRRFSNDAIGLWQSACFLKGGATCTTCHTDPHLPDVDRNPQLGGSLVLSSSKDEPSARRSTSSPRAGLASNALCTRCHQDIAAKLTTHTRHAAGSAGSACVECHMPRTVVSIKATMRDHTIGMPAPENTVRFGIPNACTECHADKPASWAVDALKSWRPNGRRMRLVAQAEAFTAARAGRDDAVDKLIAIAEDDSYPPLIRANAVGYLGRYAHARAGAAVLRAAKADRPAIRTAAVAALREPGHTDAAARAVVRAGLADPRRTVRIASLLTMVAQAGGDLTPTDLARFRYVGQELTVWTRSAEYNADLQRIQGMVHLLGGDVNRGADTLQISLDLAPDTPSVKFFLAIARLGQRRLDDARMLLKRVPRNDPYYERAQEQLRRLDQ